MYTIETAFYFKATELHDYFIDYANGDRRFVRISYNGRWCKKYNTRGF